MDMIIHVAVGFPLVDAYASPCNANLESVRTLLKLAVLRCIPFHFISGESGESLDGRKETLDTAGFDNYMASESYLSRAESTLGLLIAVPRLAIELPSP